MQSEYLNKTNLNTFEVATCGQGASCAGQCSALGASLCPSGTCTDDPGTCEIKFRSEDTEDEQSGGSTATLSGSDLKWCTGDGCRVRINPECCYNPNCLKEAKGKEDKKKACSWLNYLTGKSQSVIFYHTPLFKFDACFESPTTRIQIVSEIGQTVSSCNEITVKVRETQKWLPDAIGIW